MKGKAVRENIDLAFDVYCAMGGIVEKALVELERRGLRLAKSTFYDWMEKYDFERRRVQLEMERQEIRDSQLSFEESMLRDLLKQKKKYEQYFEGIQGVDNQASFAYANIIKTVIELSRKIKPRGEEKDPEELRRMADEILEMEYGIKRQ
jgi:hypothetical protein